MSINFKIFARKNGGQFAPESGGQFDRFMQSIASLFGNLPNAIKELTS